jgi:hypothetical protein
MSHCLKSRPTSTASRPSTNKNTIHHVLSRVLRQRPQNDHGTSLFVRARRVDHPKRMTPGPNRELFRSSKMHGISLCLIDFPSQIVWANRSISVAQYAHGFRELTQDLPRTHLLTAPRRPPRRSALQQHEAVRSAPGFQFHLTYVCLASREEKRPCERQETLEVDVNPWQMVGSDDIRMFVSTSPRRLLSAT